MIDFEKFEKMEHSGENILSEGYYISFFDEDKGATLDGWFSVDELRQLAQHLDPKDELAALRAENDKLREALYHIAHQKQVSSAHWSDTTDLLRAEAAEALNDPH